MGRTGKKESTPAEGPSVSRGKAGPPDQKGGTINVATYHKKEKERGSLDYAEEKGRHAIPGEKSFS